MVGFIKTFLNQKTCGQHLGIVATAFPASFPQPVVFSPTAACNSPSRGQAGQGHSCKSCYDKPKLIAIDLFDLLCKQTMTGHG